MHANIKLISKLPNLVVGLPNIKFEKYKICNVCQIGKQSKTSFDPKTMFQLLDFLGYYTRAYLDH